MISPDEIGKGGGSGKYSFRYATSRGTTVSVSHMPEELYRLRISFQNHDTKQVLTMTDIEGQLLLHALSKTAEDLKWEILAEAK